MSEPVFVIVLLLLFHACVAAVLVNMILLHWGRSYWRFIAEMLFLLELLIVVVSFTILLLGQQTWTHS